MITKADLEKHFDFNTETQCFIFKENKFKRDTWNRDFVGKEVKGVLSGGKKFIWFDNALYEEAQLVEIWNGKERNWFHKTDAMKLAEYAKKERETISKMNHTELLELNNKILSGEDYHEFIKEKALGKTKKDKVKGVVAKTIKMGKPKKKAKPNPDLKAVDLFDVKSRDKNPITDLYNHVYYKSESKTYYVKITYCKNSHRRLGYKSENEALEVRNKIYQELIEAEDNHEDMSTYKIKVEKVGRNPPDLTMPLDPNIIENNPKTGYPPHIYRFKERDYFVVEITINGKQNRRKAGTTIEEALVIRNQLYKELTYHGNE